MVDLLGDAAPQVAAVRPHGRVGEPTEREPAHAVAQAALDVHVEARGAQHTQAQLDERKARRTRERMRAQERRRVGHVLDEARQHRDERRIAAACALEAVGQQAEHEHVA